MADVSWLIVNGDDFGQSAGVNRGVITAHERGILTSASMMVRWPHAGEAAQYGRSHARLSVGLHLDFGEWSFWNGGWQRLYTVIDEDDRDAVEREVGLQLAAFRDLVGRDPSHIDSHQHVHASEPARSVVRALAAQLRVPLRNVDSRVRYCGDFYGQYGNGVPWPEGITVDALIGIIRTLESGYTEMSCHPADQVDLESMYGPERLQELATLCHPDVRRAIDSMGIRLCSFTS